jgi:hypothetical protein
MSNVLAEYSEPAGPDAVPDQRQGIEVRLVQPRLLKQIVLGVRLRGRLVLERRKVGRPGVAQVQKGWR